MGGHANEAHDVLRGLPIFLGGNRRNRRISLVEVRVSRYCISTSIVTAAWWTMAEDADLLRAIHASMADARPEASEAAELEAHTLAEMMELLQEEFGRVPPAAMLGTTFEPPPLSWSRDCW
mgnify:CR=1 FL=1